jgi:hypothetical protein
MCVRRSARRFCIEPLTPAIARLAGEALAAVKRATTGDAFVMASAALRGDVVYTCKVDDLERLRAFFQGVRVLPIGGRSESRLRDSRHEARRDPLDESRHGPAQLSVPMQSVD